MNNLIQFFKNILRFVIGLFRKPKSWLISSLGSPLPTPPSRPQDESPFEHEGDERDVVPRIRESKHCYQRHSELLIFLAGEAIENNLTIGSTLYVPRQAYVDHHLEFNPTANPRSFYNGPIARELKNHQFFQRRGIQFEQQTLRLTSDENGYKGGEVLFELKRVR